MQEETPIQVGESLDPHRGPLQMPRERPIFTGFLPRLGAFLIDGAVLYFGSYLLHEGMRAPLLYLNPWLPWLGHAAALVYFWLPTSPIGSGQTPGMMVLKARVVNAEGGGLSWSASFKRALLKQMVLFVLNFPLYYVLILPYSLRSGALVGLAILHFACLTLAIALALSVGMHPYKRGWHDLWAGSYVTPRPTPEGFAHVLNEEPDPIVQSRLRMHGKMTFLFWLLATIAILLQPMKSYTLPEFKAQSRRIQEIQALHPIDSHEVMLLAQPSVEDIEELRKAIQNMRARALERGQDVPSTDSLQAKAVFDGETIVVQSYLRHGRFRPESLSDPAFQEKVEDLRHAAWAQWQARLRENPNDENSRPLPAARRFVLVLYEPFMILFNRSILRGKVEGPADPAEGDLDFEHIEPRGRNPSPSASP